MRGTLIETLRQRLAAHSAGELSALFEKVGLPFAPIAKPEDLFDDPHLKATGGLADIKLPDGARAGETVQTVLFPLSMDGQRLGIRSDPPAMGQHTDVLLQEAGYSAAQVAALRAARAVA